MNKNTNTADATAPDNAHNAETLKRHAKHQETLRQHRLQKQGRRARHRAAKHKSYKRDSEFFGTNELTWYPPSHI